MDKSKQRPLVKNLVDALVSKRFEHLSETCGDEEVGDFDNSSTFVLNTLFNSHSDELLDSKEEDEPIDHELLVTAKQDDEELIRESPADEALARGPSPSLDEPDSHPAPSPSL